MTIRLAQPGDVPALVQLGARMHASTRCHAQPFNAHKLAGTLHELIAARRPHHLVLVADNAERVLVGGLIGLLAQQFFSDAWTASVLHHDVLPEARSGGHALRLLLAFERWALQHGAVEVTLGVHSGAGMELTERLIRRMGYGSVGGHYAKALAPARPPG